MRTVFVQNKIILLQVCVLMATCCSNAFAWNAFDKKLDVYRCQNQDDALSCNACQKFDGRKAEFKVNVEKSEVMQIWYDNGVMKGADALENCKVVDSKNWLCEIQPNYKDASFHGSTRKMVNGQFFSYSIIKLAPMPKQGMSGHFSEKYGCAK